MVSLNGSTGNPEVVRVFEESTPPVRYSVRKIKIARNPRKVQSFQ